MGGTFTAKIFVTIPIVIYLALLLRIRIRVMHYSWENEKWVIICGGLLAISLFNPLNHAPISTFSLASLFCTYILCCRVFYRLLSPPQIISGIFAGLAFICITQFILAICFPLLGMKSVTYLFQAAGEEWATRRDSRSGAVGVFLHPGNLGLFLTIATAFLLGCFLNGYKKRLTFVLLVINVLTIFLTYSRSSYVALVIMSCVILFLHHSPGSKVFSLKTVLFGVLPGVFILLGFIFISPLGALFLSDNAAEMLQARVDHWKVALDIFSQSPVIGVGLNAHLEYISSQPLLLSNIHNEFLTTNPIHNIHLIVLCEMGIIGIVIWILFIVNSVADARRNLAANNNMIFSLAKAGAVISFVIYGITDWAPFSQSVFPLFIILMFYGNKYSIFVKQGQPAHLTLFGQ